MIFTACRSTLLRTSLIDSVFVFFPPLKLRKERGPKAPNLREPPANNIKQTINIGRHETQITICTIPPRNGDMSADTTKNIFIRFKWKYLSVLFERTAKCVHKFGNTDYSFDLKIFSKKWLYKICTRLPNLYDFCNCQIFMDVDFSHCITFFGWYSQKISIHFRNCQEFFEILYKFQHFDSFFKSQFFFLTGNMLEKASDCFTHYCNRLENNMRQHMWQCLCWRYVQERSFHPRHVIILAIIRSCNEI